MNEALVRLVEVTLGHPNVREPVVRGVSFDVRAGETIALIGPSGAGKSTLLAALAGLRAPRSGLIATRHGRLTGPTPRHAVVFQDGALFPWQSLEQNILYGLRRHDLPANERTNRARALLARVHLGGDGRKYPHELSGGMKKRGAFARALATEPELLLLDEPFSAVDAATREELHAIVRSLRGVAVVLVTHDVGEVVALADRALLLAGAPARIVDEIGVRGKADVEARLAKALARLGPLVMREEERHEACAASSNRAYPLGARVAGAR